MMKKKLFLFLIVITPVLCHAQHSITGILQTADNTPVDYANIVLLAQADSTYLSGAISGVDGSFTLTMPTHKNTSYLIRITSIGYKTICQPVQPGNAGVFRMEDDAQMLGEVVVKADLPVTRLKGDAMITNVDGTVLAKAGTAQEMLDYIPGVASQRGTLEVLGRGAPIVYINGRLMRNSSELEQLSSEDILSVEVVNNPGARYNASVKAVIRIQTKKPVGEGIGFNSRTYAYYNKKWDFLEQVNLNYRKGGLDVFGMLYLYKENYWTKFVLEQDTYLDSHWKQQFKGNGTGMNEKLTTDFGMNYVFNESHSMGFKYRYDRYPEDHNSGAYDTAVTEDGTLYENTYSLSSLDSQSTKNSLNLYYNGNIAQWNIDFNTDMLWTDENNNQHVDETITLTGTNNPTQQVVTSFNEVRNRLYASKLVLSHPLFGGELAFGGEFSYTNRHSDYLNPQGILDNDASKIEESNTAIFAEYNKEIGNYQVQAGLRYEHVAFDYFQKDVRQDEQSKKYDNLFPSLSVSTSFGKVQMQLGYAQDISRPSFNSLRSHVYYANHYTYETGNPFLQPSITHNISLMGMYKWWRLTASYQKQKDGITLTTIPYSNDPNIVLFKPVNISSYDVAYIQLSATPTIAWWSPRFTLSAQKQWFEAETPFGLMNLNRPQFYFRWQNAIKLPAGFLFNLNGSWRSKYDGTNTRTNKASWRIDASLYKSLYNDRLTFQLNGNDIFLTQRSNWVNYQGQIYVTRKDETPGTRSVSFTVRYRFNQAKNKYKGTGAGDSQKNRL